MYENNGGEGFIQSLLKYIGQTIIIYTVSGGEKGLGFTGVLLQVTNDHIKLITELSSAPSNPLKDCETEIEEANISLGAITEIPLKKIAAFVHNAL